MTYAPETWVDYTTPCIDAAHLNAIEHGVDIAQGDIMVLRGLTAAIPATDPELVGRLYIETDLLERIWRDNGAGWDLVITPGGGAWALIAETILGAPAATVTFAAIPGTYSHLAMFIDARTDFANNADVVAWRANADAGNNYNWLEVMERESATTYIATRADTSALLSVCEAATARADVFGGGIACWRNYAAAGRERTCNTMQSARVGSLGGDADIRMYTYYSHWQSTAAITSLTLLPVTGPNFAAGTRFTLYGIT